MIYRLISTSAALILAFSSMIQGADFFYVSNWGDNSVSQFRSNGTFQSSIANGDRPEGLALDSLQNIYIGYRYNDSIKEYDSAGTLQSTISSNLNRPIGLTFDKSGNLYAANDGLGSPSPDSISKFNSTGQFQSALTSNVLHDSHGIVIDSSGNLYVADFTGGKINKFDPGGNQLFSITSNLSGPIGLALDQSGNLYASNYNNNSISIFNSSGSYQSSISSNLSGPIGLAFDNAGRLFAVNNTNNSISIFASNGTYISSITTGLSGPRFIAISATSVPEPSTYALATIASVLMALSIRRRNRSKVCLIDL